MNWIGKTYIEDAFYLYFSPHDLYNGDMGHRGGGKDWIINQQSHSQYKHKIVDTYPILTRANIADNGCCQFWSSFLAEQSL